MCHDAQSEFAAALPDGSVKSKRCELDTGFRANKPVVRRIEAKSRMKFSRIRPEPECQADTGSGPPTPKLKASILHETTPGRVPLSSTGSQPPSPVGQQPTTSIGEHIDDVFLRRCAARWLHRSGGRALQKASGVGYYDKLLAGTVGAEEEEQIQLDVDRSTVDGLQDIYVASLNDEVLQAALARLLRAWCCRRPGGYTQGMNFVAMVLLVVMHHGCATWGEHGARRAEESAFWTFVAIMEHILPLDFYEAPSMPGLQTDVRVLVALFQMAQANNEMPCGETSSPIGDDEWRSILTLACYKWFVPCYVNTLPLPTLLLYWDKMLLGRQRRDAMVVETGVSASHLQLALALVQSALQEASEAMASSRPEEGLGLGFETVMRVALAQEDAHELLSAAAKFDVSPRQLTFLRARLVDGGNAAGARRPRRRGELPAQPSLSGLQVAAVKLMQRSAHLPLRVLQRVLMLQPPPAPPIGGVATCDNWPCLPRLVSTCTLTFAAACLYATRSTFRSLTRRP